MRRTSAALIFVSAVTTVFWSVAGQAENTERMDRVVQEYVDKKQFMGSVLVARGDQILFSKGYGEANLEWHIPNAPTTKFRLGSITKQFTAASILLLEERGKLKVDDPLKKYMTDAPWDTITLKHLLTHTSGVPSVTSLPDFEQRKVHATQVKEVISWFRDKPLEFVPGEKMAYSNSGYICSGSSSSKSVANPTRSSCSRIFSRRSA